MDVRFLISECPVLVLVLFMYVYQSPGLSASIGGGREGMERNSR